MNRAYRIVPLVVAALACGCVSHQQSGPIGPGPTSPEPAPSLSPGSAPPGTASRGIAVAIGLNSVDPGHYDGWSGDLGGCEPDANDMAAIARQKNLEVHTLLTRQATRSAVMSAIRDAAARLDAGDLFVLSYSGHGGQVRDINGDESNDHLDETWCLYDGELLDDELYGYLAEFKPGVRALVFSDSCHSGTVVKMEVRDFDGPPAPARGVLLRDRFNRSAVPPARLKEFVPKMKPSTRGVAERAAPAREPVYRAMPPVLSISVYQKNKAFYDQIGAAAPREDRLAMRCSVVLISGCADDQLSADLGTNGLFTYMLKDAWGGGAFAGDHPAFHRAIRTGVSDENARQVPAYFTIFGDAGACSRFERQNPYALVVP